MKERSFIRFKILFSDDHRLVPYSVKFWEFYEQIAACTSLRSASQLIRHTATRITLDNLYSTHVKPNGEKYPEVIVVQRKKRFLFFEEHRRGLLLLELEISRHTVPGTHVTFYREKRDGSVMAYFPGIAWDNRDTKTCYSSAGQHSSCSPGYIRRLYKATREEYAPLLAELQAIGYDDLVVLNFR